MTNPYDRCLFTEREHFYNEPFYRVRNIIKNENDRTELMTNYDVIIGIYNNKTKSYDELSLPIATKNKNHKTFINNIEINYKSPSSNLLYEIDRGIIKQDSRLKQPWTTPIRQCYQCEMDKLLVTVVENGTFKENFEDFIFNYYIYKAYTHYIYKSYLDLNFENLSL